MTIDTQQQTSLNRVGHQSSHDAVVPNFVDYRDARSEQREPVERYIASIFHAAHGASVLEFLPLLVFMEQDRALQAALGLRGANNARLFCESYLPESVEKHVADTFGRTVNRSQVMELGNLVASQPGKAVSLYLLVVAALGQAGISHLVFAANRAVRLSIKRCGFITREVCAADPAQLDGKAQHWGSYYEGDPKVVLADIAQAVEHGRCHPRISVLWQREKLAIDSLADAIRSQRV
jgi:hypothetical protein